MKRRNKKESETFETGRHADRRPRARRPKWSPGAPLSREDPGQAEKSSRTIFIPIQ